jgi:hypothetical protein
VLSHDSSINEGNPIEMSPYVDYHNLKPRYHNVKLYHTIHMISCKKQQGISQNQFLVTL